MVSMIRYCSLEDLWSFIGQYKGSCGLFVHAEDKQKRIELLKPEDQKLLTIEYILSECQSSKSLAIDLQKWFGQFDEAQICEHCGDIMWDGYSIKGSTYCSLDCCICGTNWELKQLAEELIDKPLGRNEIWNVNFPGCSLEECKGIRYDTVVSQDDFYAGGYDIVAKDGDKISYMVNFDRNWDGTEGTDLKAIIDNYVSVGKVKNYS